MTNPELSRYFTVKGIFGCYHISSSTFKLVWISDDKNNLILTNKTGKILYEVEYFIYREMQVVDMEYMHEIIYVDSYNNIRKITNDLETSCVMETTGDNLRYHCLCWSPFSGDLLVVMYNPSSKTGKLTRYDYTGQLMGTIQYDNTGQSLYDRSFCVTENNNGGVIVSDLRRGVVVTDREGFHPFNYTGPPSGSRVWSRGICTDAMSHILVCDIRTYSVHI